MNLHTNLKKSVFQGCIFVVKKLPVCIPLGVSNHYAWNAQGNIWLLKLSFTEWMWAISVVGSMWPFLPWERSTFERVQRSADRWRPAADRRASWRSVAINSPNYARSKIQSGLPVFHQSTNSVSGRLRKCLKIQSSPSEKNLSGGEQGAGLFHFVSLVSSAKPFV